MSRNFYLYGIFFFGLSVACGIAHSIIYFQLGAPMYYLQPYANWFLVQNLIALAGAFFLLRYFHYKKYRFAFSAGVVAAILTFCQSVFTYITLILVARELANYNLLILLLTLGAGIVFASSLIFSRAGERSLLKTAGICMLVSYLVFIAALFWGLISPNFMVAGTFRRVEQWASFVVTLVPVLYILNFRSELRLLPAEEMHVTQLKPYESLWAVTGVMAVVFSLFLGVSLAKESYWALDWRERAPAVAEELAQPFETHVYVNSQGDSLPYLLLKPLNYDPQKKYPLVVCLHGGPSAANTGKPRHVEVSEPAPLLSTQENRIQYPAFLFVPQCPPGFSWGGVPGFPAADSLVFETIQALEDEFEIDENRRYVAGVSGGGYGSWYFISTRPEMFAAAIPVCGAGNPALASNLVNVPVWAFHGRVDRNVPVSGSREMVEAIKDAGGNPRYSEFPDVGHNVWPHVNDTAGLMDWLFAQKRD